MKTFLVETISLVKRTYIIEAKESEHACDSVVCSEATPSHIEHLDEVISGARHITDAAQKAMLLECGNISSQVGESAVNSIDYDACRVRELPEAEQKKVEQLIQKATACAAPKRL